MSKADELKEKLKNDPEAQQRAYEFADMLFKGIQAKEQLDKMTNEQLARLLIEYIGCDFDCFSPRAMLIDAVVERLVPELLNEENGEILWTT